MFEVNFDVSSLKMAR